MPEFVKFPGFIVYRNRAFLNPYTGEPDLTRVVLAEVHLEEQAQKIVDDEIAKSPGYKGSLSEQIYYEPGTIYD